MKRYSMTRLWPDVSTGNSRKNDKKRSIVYRTYRRLTRWFSRNRAVNTLGLRRKHRLMLKTCDAQIADMWVDTPSEWATFQWLGHLRMQQYVTWHDIRAYWTGEHCTSMSGTAQWQIPNGELHSLPQQGATVWVPAIVNWTQNGISCSSSKYRWQRKSGTLLNDVFQYLSNELVIVIC